MRLNAFLAAKWPVQRTLANTSLANEVAPFDRPEDVGDPDKVNALGPKYGALDGKEDDFVRAIGAIAAIATSALAELV